MSLVVALVLALAPAVATGETQTRTAPQAPVVQTNNIRYQMVARAARLNRRVMGDVTDSVRGVPASPVDSLVYDGVGSTPIEDAIVIFEVDPVKQSGLLRARWKDHNGSWEVFQDFFHHPEHSSGIRIGSSRDVTCG